MGPGRGGEELTLGGLAIDGAPEVRGRHDPLGQVVEAGEVGAPLRHREHPAPEERLQRGPAHAPEPGVLEPGRVAGRVVEVVGGERAALPDLGQDLRHVFGHRVEPLLEPPGARPVRLPPVGEQRPGLHRHDRGLVGPLLDEVDAAEEGVEERPVERAVAREEHLVLRRDHHGHVVDLEQAEPPHRGEEIGRADRPGRTRTAEALGGERDPPGLGEGEVGPGHPGGRLNPESARAVP